MQVSAQALGATHVSKKKLARLRALHPASVLGVHTHCSCRDRLPRVRHARAVMAPVTLLDPVAFNTVVHMLALAVRPEELFRGRLVEALGKRGVPHHGGPNAKPMYRRG